MNPDRPTPAGPTPRAAHPMTTAACTRPRRVTRSLSFMGSVLLPASLLLHLGAVTSWAGSGDATDQVTGTTGCVNGKLEVKPDPCEESESILRSGSLILAGGLRYLTWSHDYISHSDAAACRPCGGASAGSSRLPELEITRHTEPLSYTRPHLAFGQMSGLKTYEQSLRLARNKSHVTFDNFGEMNAKITTDFNPGLQAWTTIWRKDQGIAAIHLFNVAGQPIALEADRDSAHTAVVMRYDGTSSHFQIFWNSNGDGWGRLVALLDRHGNAIEIEYIDAHFDTLLNPIGNPRDYFRKSLIRDAYGREAHFTYQLIFNRHVVSRIDLPNGQHISYSYGDSSIGKPMLQSVTHADGSESTLSVVDNTATKTTEITIHDSKADAGHRRKKVFLSQNKSFAPGGGIMTTVKSRIRRAQNGAGEFIYDSRFTANLADRFVYFGGNSVKKLIFPDGNNGLGSAEHVTNDLWVEAFHTSDLSSWTTETELSQRINNKAHFPVSRQDARDRTTVHTRDPLSLEITANQYPDASTSSTTRNQFTQVLTSTDRLGRQTSNSYSPLGDLLTRTVAPGTADEATYVRLYNTRGQVIEERDALYDGNFPELHNTRYEYDANGYLVKEIQAADSAGGPRPETLLTWDTAGRLASVTDPVGRVTSFAYDAENRLIETTYNDSSTEIIEYGQGLEANLIVKRTDRNGIETTYQYDQADRTTQTVVAANTADPSVETCAYLTGTRLKETTTRDGDLTEYHYDHRNRLIGTTRHADQNTQLSRSTEYDELGRTRSTTDAYGRSTYHLYDHNDRRTRTVTETVPGGLGAVPDIVPGSQQTAAPHIFQLTTTAGEELNTSGTHSTSFTCPRDLFLVNLTRDPSANAPYTIEDTIYDAAGQAVIRTDSRGTYTWLEYDQRGRNTRTITAVGTAEEIRSETDFDDNSNTIEVRQPRHFSEGIAAIEQYTYNGRNLTQTHTTNAGGPGEATQSYTYTLDGRPYQHTDFRGNITTSIYHNCCGRLQATVDKDGNATTIYNTDFKGNPTHTAVVGQDPSALPGNNWHDPVDADTLAEQTTRFDGRDRPTHNTRWLITLGDVDDDARANLGTGDIPISSNTTDGLTTTYAYDDDLTDGQGIDSDHAAQLTTLANRGIGFGPNSTGSATAVTNAEGETSVQIRDGLGRTAMTINGEAEITTYHYDSLASGVDLANGSAWNGDLPLPGSYLATTVIDALGNATTRYTDGLGRTVAVKDAQHFVSALAYDPNGNLLIRRAADGTGEDCTYDALGRRVTCADLQEQAENTQRSWTYNAHGQVLEATDALGALTSTTYDERGRTVASADRNLLTTTYSYDPNSNLLTLTDPENNTRSWTYDPRDLVIRKEYGAHTPGTSPGDPGYDALTHSHDALRRPLVRTDQEGRDTEFSYDLAGRLITRTYRQAGGAIESQDTLDYDAASRLITGIKGRYSVTIDITYDFAGRPTEETTTVFGKTYTLGAAYDLAGRPTHLTFPDGKIQQTTYDARSLPVSLIYDGATLATLAHNPAGLATTRTFGSGIVETISYSRADQLRSAVAATTLPGGSNVGTTLDFSYSYDANKRVLSETPATNAPGSLDDADFAVTYDDGGRVTTWQRDDNHSPPGYGGEQTWTYDDAGNWDSTKIGGSTQNRNHDDSDQLTSLGGTSLNYTLNGNLSKDHHNNQYSWDIDNRLSAKTHDGQALGTADYQYDVLGRRVAKDSGGGSAGKTVTLWWNMREVADYETTGTNPDPIHHYLNLPRHNDRLARTVQVGSSEQVQYYHKNYLDHVYAITDEDGDALEHIRYTAFGLPQHYDFSGLKTATSPTGNQFLWNGKRLDPQLGWYVYHYRHYSPELGRWPSRDPIGERGGVNLYGFVGNGPIAVLDYLGLLETMEIQVAVEDEARARDWLAWNAAMKAGELTDQDEPLHREYGGAICSKKCKHAETDEVCSITIKATGPNRGNIGAFSMVSTNSFCPSGWKAIGGYHSHPRDGRNKMGGGPSGYNLQGAHFGDWARFDPSYDNEKKSILVEAGRIDSIDQLPDPFAPEYVSTAHPDGSRGVFRIPVPVHSLTHVTVEPPKPDEITCPFSE